MTRPERSWSAILVDGLIAFVCMALLVGAGSQLWRYLNWNGGLRAAVLLERDVSAVGDRQLADEASLALARIEAGECETTLVRAAMTLTLVQLSRHNPTVSDELWSGALDGAERVIQGVLRCTPTDGNAWIRLAMVQRAAAESTPQLVALADLSNAFAPAEMRVIAARLAFWNTVSSETRTAGMDAIDRDVRNVVFYASAPIVSEIYKAAHADIRERMRLAAQLVSDRRRKADLIDVGLQDLID